MLISVNNYTWKQNYEKIHISLPLKNVQYSKLHLFIESRFIKLNFCQYIFEVFLKHSIISSKTRCIIKPNEVVLELVKTIPEEWETLHEELDKKGTIEIKKQAIQKKQENATILKEKNEKEKTDRKHFLQEYQVSRYKEEKEKICHLKDQQKKKALEELTIWKGNLKDTTYSSNISKKNFKNNDKFVSTIPVPFPRNDGKIQFSFSSRVFSTPKRESKIAEEEEWLKKEAEAIRATGFIPNELTEEEKNPMWLLNKGTWVSSFFEKENYLGALNAFLYGRTVAPKMHIFYIKLAETYLKLNQYCKTIENATVALEMLMPVVRENKNLRAEVYKVRAVAYKNIDENLLSAADCKSARDLLI
ncbi:hypothetical protein PGB90_006115 [Kerria lacca]